MLAGITPIVGAVRNGNDNYTKLLLHCDGANGSTVFADSSMSSHTVTQNGVAAVDTAQSKFGTGSARFTSAAGYLALDGSSDFAFGSGDFTIDFWLRPNSVSSFQHWYDSRPNGTNGAYLALRSNGSLIQTVVNDSALIADAGTLVVGTWTHVAIARSGTSTKLFKDGVQIGINNSDNTVYLNPASRPAVGVEGWSMNNYRLNGWVDELRVSKGIARWTSNFMPPTGPYR